MPEPWTVNPSVFVRTDPTRILYPTLGLVVSLLSPRLTGGGYLPFQIPDASDGSTPDAFWIASSDGYPDHPPF